MREGNGRGRGGAWWVVVILEGGWVHWLVDGGSGGGLGMHGACRAGGWSWFV